MLNRPWLYKIVIPVWLILCTAALQSRVEAFTCHEWTEAASGCTTEPVLCEETPERPANHVLETIPCEGEPGEVTTCQWCLAPDEDDDGVVDADDNCPLIANPEQTDTDDNGIGDACDDDDDGDGVDDTPDNCPLTPNADQADMDLDTIGDVCDADMDGDGLSNVNETGHGSDPAVPDLITWVDDDDPACGGNSPCHSTIQAGIDASGGVTGYDIVVVRDGLYQGTGNMALDFNGKNIIVRSENGAEYTIIDCEKAGRGFHFHMSETRDAVVDGFTIRNGYTAYDVSVEMNGSGILIEGDSEASPTIRYCVFEKNVSYWHGGAIYVTGPGRPAIEKCTFIGNHAYFQGGGIAVRNQDPWTNSLYSQITVSGCRFYNNSAGQGGALYVSGSDDLPELVANNTLFESNQAKDEGGAVFLRGALGLANTLANCTFVHNTAAEGAAIWLENMEGGEGNPGPHDMGITLWNSIVWGNVYQGGSGQIHAVNRGDGDVRVDIGHSLLDGGLGGVAGGAEVSSLGNVINTDPGFVFPDNYHLDSDSVCIDAGTSTPPPLAATDLDGSTRSLGAAVDLGVYEYGGEQAPEFVISPPRLDFSMVADIGSETVTDAQMLSLRNYTAAAQGWQAVIPEACTWLEADGGLAGESSGEIDQIALRADILGLSPGSHECSLTIIAENNPEAPILVPVTLQINSTLVVEPDGSTDYPTIQDAIDAAVDGDTVLVRTGIYTGERNRDINFRGKAIRVVAEESGFATIDCEGLGRGFVFNSGETSDSVLRGFKIINGSASLTGAVDVLNSSPLISECVFEDNLAGALKILFNSDVVVSDCTFSGNVNLGAVYVQESTVDFRRCLFSGNTRDEWGGALQAWAATVRIDACRFLDNTAGTAPDYEDGGAIFYRSGSDEDLLQITNSSFVGNRATYRGGAIYIYGSWGTIDFVNNTFVDNRIDCAGGTCSGGAVHFNQSGFDGRIVNSIFIDNQADQGNNFYFLNGLPSSLSLSYNGFSPEEPDFIGDCLSCIEIPAADDPGLVDIGSGDLRLKFDSPFVDAGTTIADLFTDQRGSVRPVDGPDADLISQFDMGAFEYSGNYSGTEDEKVQVFHDVRVKSPIVIIDYDYQIVWKDRDPFPWNDPRFSQAGEYTLRFALIDSHGRRVDLGTFTKTKGPAGVDYEYSVEYTFNRSHIGIWYLLVEVVGATDLYALSDSMFTISEGTPDLQAIGTAVSNPLAADNPYRDILPDLDPPDLFYWSGFTNTLYAVGPGVGVITWYEDEYRTIPVPRVVSNQMPATVQFHIANTPEVELLPEGSPYDSVRIMYSSSGAQRVGSTFTANSPGDTVLLYFDEDNMVETFEVVRTILWNDPDYLAHKTWNIGQTISEPDLHNPDCGSGWVLNAVSPYEGAGDHRAYDRDERTGPIIPVNEDKTEGDAGDDLVVVWYQKGTTGADWPHAAVHYNPKWPDEPTDPEDPHDANRIPVAPEDMLTIEIHSGLGSGPLVADTYGDPDDIIPYNQPDDGLPGFNPNEEHAFLAVSLDGTNNEPALFVLRNDLNNGLSEPYALLKYRDPAEDGQWALAVFKVVAPESIGPADGYTSLTRNGVSGMLLNAPYPLPTLYFNPCADTGPADYSPDSAAWKDKNGELWAMNPDDGNPTLNFWYPLKASFYYDLDNDGEADAAMGECIPWELVHTGESETKPVAVTYEVCWPDQCPEPRDLPVLYVGETLMDAKNGLPNITNQCSVGLEYGSVKARLYDPLIERSVELEALPDEVDFEDLPFHLNVRISFDADTQALAFMGYYDDSMAGEPLLLPNVMSESDRVVLEQLIADDPDRDCVNQPDAGCAFLGAVEELYDETRIYLGLPLLNPPDPLPELRQELSNETAESKALSAGAAASEGYVILSFNDAVDEDEVELCVAPVNLSVIRVECPSYTGDIKAIEPENVFDNRVTMRHSGDFGGEPDQVVFQWKWMDYTPNPPDPDDEDWNLWFEESEDIQGIQGSKAGAVEIVVEGPGDKTLSDKWFIVRSLMVDGPCGEWSAWTAPQLYQGWVKRVLAAINLFDQRIRDFEDYAPNTLASMIQQAGERYEGDAALNYDPDNLDSLGLIEFYQTILNLSLNLTIDAAEPTRTAASDQTLLLVASRLTDLYMLLGNDAYADALDPTIGFSTDDSGEYGSAVTAVFAFQNQVATLLEEELALLRGRDDEGVRPFYNHLVWNFTQTEGEVAYRQNYNIFDWDGDGFLTKYDARAYFPMGHGDAWGHYLSGIKIYYHLLRHPYYVWTPRPESLLVAGTPVSVDYEDERRFARAAAAKAKTGADVVGLTFRQHYDGSRDNQLDGHRDAITDRAWGVDEWAARTGQAAYFDWVTANAILPAKDPLDCRLEGVDLENCHEGLALVDRTTVMELREIPTTFQQIQTTADKADSGLNPLGLARAAVPFDFDPTFDEVGSGIQNVVYFEQMYERAVDALNNAVTVFDHANQNTQLIYQQQDSIGDFQVAVEAEERSFTNELIEIYGYPYPDDCGPGKTYPSEYCQSGPDLFHWMYVDGLDELINLDEDEYSEITDSFTLTQDYDAYAWQTDPPTIVLDTVEYNVIASKYFTGLPAKDKSWTGKRLAPGELQMAFSDLLQLIGEYRQSMMAYSNLKAEIEDTTQFLNQQIELADRKVSIESTALGAKTALNVAILAAKASELGFALASEQFDETSDAITEGIPNIIGLIAGMSNGAISDPLGPMKGAIKEAGYKAGDVFNVLSNLSEWGGLALEISKEEIDMSNELTISKYEDRQEIKGLLLELQNLIRSEAELRIELLTLLEGIHQARINVDAIKAAGQRILEERLIFRTLTAADIQAYRYKDMAFRLFRDDALRKYRAQFDMAALYTYLAAKAYDYETALLDSDTGAGRNFLADIVRQRSIGQVEDGEPLTGTGLADILKRMKLNFQVFKPQMGLNNPQFETNQFSLRSELFRFLPDSGSDDKWRETIEDARVDDLWQVPEFKRYCRPFAEEGIPQPGIVISFSTDVTAGHNFFGQPLGGGDSYYSAANYATKIWSAGIWFSNYDSAGLAMTPRVYLVPVGEDILRSPTDNSGAIRTWQVADQKIPVPFPVSASELANNPDWIPQVDSLQDELFGIRRHGDFRAYHDSGYADESEMTYDARLIGRSVWNTRWLLIIPGQNLYVDPLEGIERFINGPETYSGSGLRTDNGVKDIKLYFHTYSFSGN